MPDQQHFKEETLAQIQVFQVPPHPNYNQDSLAETQSYNIEVPNSGERKHLQNNVLNRLSLDEEKKNKKGSNCSQAWQLMSLGVTVFIVSVLSTVSIYEFGLNRQLECASSTSSRQTMQSVSASVDNTAQGSQNTSATTNSPDYEQLLANCQSQLLLSQSETEQRQASLTTCLNDAGAKQIQKTACVNSLATCAKDKDLASLQRNSCFEDKNLYFNQLTTCLNDKSICLSDKNATVVSLATCETKLKATYSSVINCTNLTVVVEQASIPAKAFCGNYLFAQVSSINLNYNSCSNCSRVTGTCLVCTDRLNSTYTGTSCFGCVIPTGYTIGACTSCNQCTQLSYSANCKRTNNLVTSLNLDGKSCLSCTTVNGLVSCGTCNDKSKNGNVGTTCSDCFITQSGTGICKSCDLCSSNYYTAICSAGFFTYLDHFYTSCQNCTGSTCLKCKDRAGNGNYAIDCSSCTITNLLLGKGYCSKCRVCLPMKVGATCVDRSNLIYINDNSCNQCSTIAGATSCVSCNGTQKNGDFGINCTNCVITGLDNAGLGKGYCYSCNVCIPKVQIAVLGNSPFFHLTLNESSCYDCKRLNNDTVCENCEDMITGLKGQKGSQCSISLNGKSTCKILSMVYPLKQQIQCINYGTFYINQRKLITNQYGCAQCMTINSQVRCKTCQDLGTVYKGYDCTACTLWNSTHGFCSKCNSCTPYRYIGYCANYNYISRVYLQLNESSCTQCSYFSGSYYCNICTDLNNNTGKGCSQCTVGVNNTGFCSYCSTCINPPVTSTQCKNSNKQFYANYSCTSCAFENNNLNCAQCNQAYGGITKGYGCWSCVQIQTGTRCGGCSMCLPVRQQLMCGNNRITAFGTYFYVNQRSCSNCTTQGQDNIVCDVCIDFVSPDRKGYKCSYCKTWNNQSYCTYCSYCTPIAINLYCSSQGALFRQYMQINQNSCKGCKFVNGYIQCESCRDLFSKRYGLKCKSCELIKDDTGYCNYCEICGPVRNYAACDNAPYSFDKLILNESSCANCTMLNSVVRCAICNDATTGVRSGLDCVNCRLFSNNSGLCTLCYLCLPSFAMATCDNYIQSYRLLDLDYNSCNNCTTVDRQTACSKCVDRSLNGNTGYNCRGCKQQSDGSAYCTACVTCL